jgi:hypothetical protein
MPDTVYEGLVIILIDFFRVNVFTQILFSNLSAFANRRKVAWDKCVNDGIRDLKGFV